MGPGQFLIVHVDNIILTGNNIAEMKRLKRCLVTKFEVKDLSFVEN